MWQEDGVGGKKGAQCEGRRVKGSEVERGGKVNKKIKAHGAFPLGRAITFSEICVTLSTPCQLEGPGVSALGCPLEQVCQRTCSDRPLECKCRHACRY